MHIQLKAIQGYLTDKCASESFVALADQESAIKHTSRTTPTSTAYKIHIICAHMWVWIPDQGKAQHMHSRETNEPMQVQCATLCVLLCTACANEGKLMYNKQQSLPPAAQLTTAYTARLGARHIAHALVQLVDLDLQGPESQSQQLSNCSHMCGVRLPSHCML